MNRRTLLETRRQLFKKNWICRKSCFLYTKLDCCNDWIKARNFWLFFIVFVLISLCFYGKLSWVLLYIWQHWVVWYRKWEWVYVRVYNALKVMIYPGGQLSQFFLKTLSFNSEGLTINDAFFKWEQVCRFSM